MKFLQKEFEDMQDVLVANGKDPDEFHHVKKRGHIYVHQQGRKDAFCFIRKKESILNKNQKFEDKYRYFLDAKNKKEVSSWKEVLKEFDSWLKQ